LCSRLGNFALSKNQTPRSLSKVRTQVTAAAEGLYDRYRQDRDSNALILDPKVKKPASKAAPEVPQKKLSKSQKRKVKKIEEDKLKRAERAQVFLHASPLHVKRSAQKVCCPTNECITLPFL